MKRNVKLRLTYSPANLEKPIIAKTILKTGVLMNILAAKITAQAGEVTVAVDAKGKQLEKIIRMFRNEGVMVEKVYRTVEIDEEKCISCGACVSSCPVGAITMDSDWNISFNEEKCVGCKICITACPLQVVHPI
jgi:ferredoxin